MRAVVHPPAAVAAVSQPQLIAAASHIVELDGTCARAVVCLTVGHCRVARESELTANDPSVAAAPEVIAHCAPLTIVEHLNTAVAVGNLRTGD